MLCLSGELDYSMGGSLIPDGTKADYDYQHSTTRRSIYHPVFRNSLPELFEAFDFADTSVSTGKRPRSTVSTQALVLMNHPWVVERVEKATALTRQTLAKHRDEDTIEQLVERLYIQALNRRPTDSESELAIEYLADSEEAAPEQFHHRLMQFIHALCASLDFRYLD
jgi:hypothetical protein